MQSKTAVWRELGLTWGDITVAALLLAGAAAMWLLMQLTAPSPQYVVVKAEGQEVCRLPLDKDCVYDINGTNTIEIADGAVRMIQADCPDKVCVHTGAISESGRVIVCAPHHITVTIIGEQEAADVYAR